MRDNIWLDNRMNTIWQKLMPEVEKENQVNIHFGRFWKNKFGHIARQKDGSSQILINSYFRDNKVPEYIIDLTIAHELVHYMHGFQSPRQQQFRYPHQGNIVNKELKLRGFEILLILEKQWVKNQWWNLHKSLSSERKSHMFITD
ncbi:hypothetical protein HOD61_03150 [archaeon]|jgi:hypothetical protein|nr:hypothetical protein [archaeon]